MQAAPPPREAKLPGPRPPWEACIHLTTKQKMNENSEHADFCSLPPLRAPPLCPDQASRFEGKDNMIWQHVECVFSCPAGLTQYQRDYARR